MTVLILNYKSYKILEVIKTSLYKYTSINNIDFKQ